LHGHTYVVQVRVGVGRLDRLGMGGDFRKLRNALEKVLKRLDHRNLNELAFFKKNNATAEYIAKYIFDNMKEKRGDITAVTVWEGPNYSVTYSPDEA
jgi:6-pyruvoyltetrahydropterin/6-carboxytetrahydropterin synthase